jgi:hypothetical protein
MREVVEGVGIQLELAVLVVAEMVAPLHLQEAQELLAQQTQAVEAVVGHKMAVPVLLAAQVALAS